jgi:hypothetical protein
LVALAVATVRMTFLVLFFLAFGARVLAQLEPEGQRM